MIIQSDLRVCLFSEAVLGDVFFHKVYGVTQLGVKAAFGLSPDLAAIVYFTNNGNPDEAAPSLVDARSFGNERIIVVPSASFRPTVSLETIHYNQPDYMNVGAIILSDDTLTIRCRETSRTTRDVDLTTSLVGPNRPASPKFWISKASIIVPSDAGTFRELATVTARGNEL